VGLDAAKLNLRLAKELSNPADRVEDAHWLLGAHLLSGGDPTGALAQFQQCSPEKRPLFAGYVLLARILLPEPGAQHEFDGLLAAMRARGNDEGKFNESQLSTAHRVFVGRGD
jgi:hypothetical protein